MSDILEARNRVPKVLIADDDPGIVKFLADRCADMGFEVQTATNGLQAMIIARRSPPDVLIVDVNMPEVDGLSVCLHLLSPGGSFDVIVVTGSSNPETVERCKSLGAYYARKGPDLWDSVRSALTNIFHNMPNTIVEGTNRHPLHTKVWIRPRVLVVDDDPDVEKFLSSRLRKSGVDTLYASDCTKGFRLACKEQPSVIISDFFMPNGDALYLLTQLRNTAATANIPFIVMSGRPLDKLIEQSLQRQICGRPGAARILSKQFDTQELFAAIQKFCAFDPTANRTLLAG